MKKTIFAFGLIAALGLVNAFAHSERYVWGTSEAGRVLNKAFCYPNKNGPGVNPVSEDLCRCTQGTYFAIAETLNPNEGKKCFEMANLGDPNRKLSLAPVMPDQCFSVRLGAPAPKSAELLEFCRTNGLLKTADAQRK